jgi:hypothetical protein
MKLKIRKRHAGIPDAPAVLIHFCDMLDGTIPRLRTWWLVAGIIAAALRTGELADYLFVTGLLMHMAIWFENWWQADRSR